MEPSIVHLLSFLIKETLTFMVGQKESDMDQELLKIVKSMGKNIFYCGEVGHGQIAKMCNNLALAIQMASITEAMILGKKSGMDL